MVDKMSNIKPDDIDVIDITALFAEMPINKSLEIILDKLEKGDTILSHTLLTPSHIWDLLVNCLTTTHFQYDDVIYIQVKGEGMGTPVSPIIAKLYMEWFEETNIYTYPFEITLCHRYVNNTIVGICDSFINDLKAHISYINLAI